MFDYAFHGLKDTDDVDLVVSGLPPFSVYFLSINLEHFLSTPLVTVISVIAQAHVATTSVVTADLSLNLEYLIKNKWIDCLVSGPLSLFAGSPIWSPNPFPTVNGIPRNLVFLASTSTPAFLFPFHL